MTTLSALFITQWNLVRFSKFLFLQKACENRHMAKYWVRKCAPCAPTSTATVNILYAFYCNKNQFHGRSIPEGYFQRHLQTSFYSSIVKITFFEITLWLGQFLKIGNIKQQGMNFPGKISNKHGHLRFVKGALKYCVAYKTY